MGADELKQELRAQDNFQRNTLAYDGGARKSKVQGDKLVGGLAQRALGKKPEED